MIYIQKREVPDFLTEYIKKNPLSDYDSPTFTPFHQRLRAELIREQRGLCAYCCSRITLDNSHNEHIEPRHKKDGTTSKRSLDYGNIVASCDTSNTCGIRKGNDYDEKRFVSPLQENCEEHFSYSPDGYMNGDEYTIKVLNLNSYELRRARRAVYSAISSMTEEDIRLVYCSEDEDYQPYSNVIFWFLNDLKK